jgi:hypothetical protein
VQRAVREGEQAEGSPVRRELRPAEPAAQRRDRQRREQETQRPQPGGVGDGLDRLRAQVVAQRTDGERRERQQAGRDERRVDRSSVQKFWRRSMPAYSAATWSA